MSQSSVVGGVNGPDFSMPEEILAVIPTDPYDQLDLARKITSMAIASRVSNLESDAGRTRLKLQEKDRAILELEDEVARLQQACLDAESRLKTVLDDNMKLTKERDSLAMTTKKLNRDLAKLETFKRQLMQSLNDDNSPQAESVDIRTCDQSAPRSYPDDVRNDHTSQHSFNGSSNIPNSNDASRNAQRFSVTPYITPRFTPAGTPKVISTAGSPRKTSGATSPARSLYDGRGSLSSWYPSSHQSSAANSPPRNRSLPARAPRIDGKEFFRQARSRLSYEQFSAFLANIKELNAQKQTREDTLKKAEEIFGTDNKDLYLSFQGLLTRKIN